MPPTAWPLDSEEIRFTDLLNNDNELIDVHRLVELFNSVTPRLCKVLNKSSTLFLRKWVVVKRTLAEKKNYGKNCRLIVELDTVYKTRYQNYVKRVNSFNDVTTKFANHLQNQISYNEKELLVMIFQSRSMIPEILDLLRDVDSLVDDMRSIFSELCDFLDEIDTHFLSVRRCSSISVK